MGQSKNPNSLYQQASQSDTTEINFWGNVPKSFQEAVDLAIDRYNPGNIRVNQPQTVEKLKEILRSYHKDLGIYSSSVEENMKLLDKGSILVGQQPVVMGGPGLIANKLACLLHLSELFRDREQDLAPVFFVGDYDGLQKELARQYFPNPISHNAFIIDSEDYLPEESDIAAHAATVPPLDWLELYLDKLTDNLRGFRSQVKGDKKKLLDERWDHIQTLLKSTLNNSLNLSDWAMRIWGTITNVIADYGVIYLPTSHPEIRKFVAPKYLPFIEMATEYTKNFQRAMDLLEEQGFTPSLPHRHDDYAPFTLECGEDNNRITTTINRSDGKVLAEGKCPHCDRKYSYDVSTEKAIQTIATKIGPRVDTSQAIFQDLMNIQIRISGPGEIAYYAQAAPAVKAIGFQLPIFVKYKRAFYNGTWIEKLGKTLNSRDQPSLHQSQLFKILRNRVDGIKDQEPSKIQEAEAAMGQFIDNQFENLLNLGDGIDRDKYLGWQFGRFTPDKYGQEVSWVWFDMTLQTGIADYIETYKRMYTADSSLGGKFYINSLL